MCEAGNSENIVGYFNNLLKERGFIYAYEIREKLYMTEEKPIAGWGCKPNNEYDDISKLIKK